MSTSSKTLRARFVARRRKVGKWVKSPAGKKFTSLNGPVMAVFLVVAVISYDDIRAVCLSWGFTPKHASLMPIGIDAGMVVGFHYVAGKVRRSAKLFGLLLCLVGFSLTMTCNIMAAPDHIWGRIMGAGVGLLLGLTSVTMHLGALPVRPKKKTTVTTVRGKAPVPMVGRVTGTASLPLRSRDLVASVSGP